MNNTATPDVVIVAILIIATLVIGTFAATTTTGQSAFAYSQKKKGGGDENSRNGNTITIQKCKQAATQSGFDNNQGQECENLICTHPGENATCTEEGFISSTTPMPEPTTGTLLVKKVVQCLVGTVCPPASDFSIVVTGNSPTPASFKGSESGILVTLGAGRYTVTETDRPSDFFPPHFSGDCKIQPNDSASGTISANEHQTCTITNFNAEIP